MTSLKFKLAAFGVAVALAACGGGDSGPVFNSVVSFGDSLSDLGTYKVGTIAAIGGGKWTVNGPDARNWTEVVAAGDSISLPCPAQTGMLPNITGFQGAPVTDHPECANYAQGSARVSNPFGSPSAVAMQAAPFNQQNIGLLATPVNTQLSRHLARTGGSYSGSELVTVTVGGNDLFMNLYGVASAAAGGATAVGTAAAAGWDPSVQAAVAAGGAAAAQAATTAAVTAMGQAGAELAGLVKSQVLGKGARYVAVFNLPDVSKTPFGLTLDSQSRQLVTTMVVTFNSQLQAGLAGTPALLIDAYTRSHDWTANPAKYGITNVTTQACSTTSPANPLQGSSLGCTSASTVTPDTSGYFYADDVHPTPLGYRLMAQLAQEQIRAAGWR